MSEGGGEGGKPGVTGARCSTRPVNHILAFWMSLGGMHSDTDVKALYPPPVQNWWAFCCACCGLEGVIQGRRRKGEASERKSTAPATLAWLSFTCQIWVDGMIYYLREWETWLLFATHYCVL
jgi:hypothetical protein